MSIACVYILIFLAFFGGSLEGYKLAPPLLNWLTEPLIYFCLVLALVTSRGRLRLPLLPLILFFLAVGVASLLINERFNLEAVFGIRLILRFYIFFLAVVNLGLDDCQIKRINSFLIFLFILQIPVATIKLFFYGQGEATIGTYATFGGALSTIIPLIAVGFLIGFYFYYKEKKSYIVLALGFVYFSIIGGKRGFVFFLPALVVFSIVMLWKDRHFDTRKWQKIRWQTVVMGTLLILIVVFAGLKYVPTLNPEGVIGGSIDIGHALDYTMTYTTRDWGPDGRYSGGRIATTQRVFSRIAEKGVDRFFFGYGPGAVTTSRFISEKSDTRVFEEVRAGYGVTPMTFIAMEYGVLGVITYFVFMLSLFVVCVEYWKMARDAYWKAFSFGSLAFSFSMVVLWAAYHPASLQGDTIPLVFYYCMAVVFVKLTEIKTTLKGRV